MAGLRTAVPFVLWVDFKSQFHTLFRMGVCVLVTSGEHFDVGECLRESPFKPQQIYCRGEIPSKDNPGWQPLTESGFILLVSQDDGHTLVSPLTLQRVGNSWRVKLILGGPNLGGEEANN